MTRQEYLDYVKPALVSLGKRAAEDAISRWGGKSSEISHLIFGTTTTAIYAPTLDIALANELGLSPNVKHLNVENMGCLTGFRAINQAAEIAQSGRNIKVLVVVCDVRSAICNQLKKHEDNTPVSRPDAVVAALFRDSGGAAIVSSPDPCYNGAKPVYEILEGCSYLIPETSHMVQIMDGNNGTITLFNHKDLPSTIQAELPLVINDLLEKYNVAIQDCSFAMHTCGPRIMRNYAVALGLCMESFAASWHVMENHGNLSGASNIVVLDYLQRLAKDEPAIKEFVICVSLGPGVSIEVILLRGLDYKKSSPVMSTTFVAPRYGDDVVDDIDDDMDDYFNILD